jgi:hypothetical protein
MCLNYWIISKVWKAWIEKLKHISGLQLSDLPMYGKMLNESVCANKYIRSWGGSGIFVVVSRLCFTSRMRSYVYPTYVREYTLDGVCVLKVFACEVVNS